VCSCVPYTYIFILFINADFMQSSFKIWWWLRNNNSYTFNDKNFYIALYMNVFNFFFFRQYTYRWLFFHSYRLSNAFNIIQAIRHIFYRGRYSYWMKCMHADEFSFFLFFTRIANIQFYIILEKRVKNQIGSLNTACII